jgi:hypothetical protein
MERIVLVSDWLDRGNYRELNYAICERFCDRWLLVERAWIRLGKPSEAIEYVYDINAPFSTIYEGFQVTRYIFNNREDYFANCTLDECNLLEGYPHFEWAVACEI